MRTWIALLVVLAVIAAALIFGLGLLDGDQDEPADEPPSTNGAPPEDEPGEEDPLLRPAGPTEPDEMPELELAPMREPIGILLLVGVPQRFNAFLAQQWGTAADITVKSWAPPLPDGPREGVPSPDVLPGLLPSAPRGVTLDDENIDVVVVHDLDPSVLERDFWLEVVKRVQEGRLGLLVVPGTVTGRKMLEHDALASALPVAKAAAMEGQPVPGLFSGLASYVPTDAGTRHPASRLVSWPSWSRRIWGTYALLETPWGTNVCYPVEEIPTGAQVLLEAKPEQADSLPALIVGVPDGGRVLWFGGWDLGSRHAYGRPKIVEDWRVLLLNWTTWLAGQIED